MRARRVLNDAAGLIAYVRSLAIPSLGTMSDKMPRAASKEAPLPFRADAIDDIDDAYARLIQWVTYWSAALQVDPPATIVVVWKRGDEAQGFRVEATPAGAGQLAQILGTWRLIGWEAMLATDAGTAFVDDLHEIFRPLRGKFPRAPRRLRDVHARPYPVCGEHAVNAVWHSEDVHDVAVQCEPCSCEIPTKTYRQVLD
ncbi:hypothetical protein [Curtobacterium sp. KT1]|uniref:hypothetical protein n=1 Tax=Curtobacterium sp. KT1 TaxID=3372858 RepID=UPI0037C0C608